MKFDGATLREALEAESEGARNLARLYAEAEKRPAARLIRDLVWAYKAAPDGYRKLKPSTKKQWVRWLDEIEVEFGTLQLSALKAKGVRAEFIAWRNKRADQPRSADYGIQVLKRLLAFGLEQELIDRNPAEGIAALYKGSRADIVVESDELEAILAKLTTEARRIIHFAAATGIRRGDLVSLQWSDVGSHSVEFGTSKSGGLRRPIMPLLPEAKAIVAEIRALREQIIAHGKVPSAFLFTTAKGTPWKKDSVTQAFWRAAADAGVDKNLHDLRGTAVTRYVLAGLSDEQIADLVGWERRRVEQVRRRYVDRDRIALGVIAQMEAAEHRGDKTDAA